MPANRAFSGFCFLRKVVWLIIHGFLHVYAKKRGKKHYQKRGFVIFFFGKSPMYRVFPRGARTFRTVLKFGVVFPFSILAIMGCLTPLISSSSLWVIPLLPGLNKLTDKRNTQIAFCHFFRCKNFAADFIPGVFCVFFVNGGSRYTSTRLYFKVIKKQTRLPAVSAVLSLKILNIFNCWTQNKSACVTVLVNVKTSRLNTFDLLIALLIASTSLLYFTG